jgi:hypothetical protein
LKTKFVDCSEEPGALETNVLNQPAGCFWRPVTMAVHFRGKISRVKHYTFFNVQPGEAEAQISRNYKAQKNPTPLDA